MNIESDQLESEIITITLQWGDARPEQCHAAVDEWEPYRIALQDGRFAGRSFEGYDLFEALIALRRAVDAEGGLILCAGARVDVFPSPMARDMGPARRAYILTLGKPGRTEDLVDIFEPAEAAQIGSVEAQAEYYESWTKSL